MSQREYWEKVYANNPPEELGWYEPHLRTSLEWIRRRIVANAGRGYRGITADSMRRPSRARRMVVRRLSMLVVIAVFALVLSPHPASAVDEFELWEDFIQLVKSGEFTEDMIRPHLESLRKSNMEFIDAMKNQVSREELEAKPEIIRVNDRINYLIPLTFNNSKATYCFTFIEEGDRWYLEHIEAIFIRLDKIPPLPVSEFPDLSDSQKAWAREEIYWSERVRIFNFLVEEKSREFAFDWFKDGPGYYLAARTWVPFVDPRRAFILYLCWEQANLRGSKVVLEKLDENEAIVRIRPLFLDIYLQSSHLKQQISWEDYVQMYFTIWRDRAEKAGWKLDFKLGEYLIGFVFRSDDSKQD